MCGIVERYNKDETQTTTHTNQEERTGERKPLVIKEHTLPQRKADVSAAMMLLIDIKVATSPTVQ
jgi:hypothetical protein